MPCTCCTPPCTQAVFYDVQHFLDLYDRIFPATYLDPLKSPGPGYEVLQAYAAVFQRVSLAVARLDCGAHILQSFGATLPTVVLTFTRADALAGTMTLKAGTVCTTSKGGRDFITTQDVVFGIGDLGPHDVPAVGALPAFEFNVPGRVIAADGEVLPGDIDTIKTPLMDPPFPPVGLPNFSVQQIPDACGGQPPMLDGLGNDRGLPRAPGESDDAYKIRIRQLPDTVSPDAIVRAVTNYLAPFGVTFDFIETFDPAYQTCWDCPSPNAGTPTFQAAPVPNIDTNLFVYDDPRPPYPPFRNRWLGDEDYRGAFIIVVPNLPAFSDLGFAWDDTAMTPTDLLTADGFRSVGAYDLDANYTASSAGFYDGFDLGKAAVYKGLLDMLNRIKAGGVLAVVELQGQ
jgi:hypothetical protein